MPMSVPVIVPGVPLSAVTSYCVVHKNQIHSCSPVSNDALSYHDWISMNTVSIRVPCQIVSISVWSPLVIQPIFIRYIN